MAELAPSSQHFAQYYDNVEFLIASLEEYVRQGYEKNEGLLIIAGENTWVELLNALRKSKIHAAEMFATGQLVYLDAEKVAHAISDAQGPNRQLFHKVIHPTILSLRHKYKNIRCYGEVIDLLCSQGKANEAIALEDYWNEYLHTQNNITLMCGYANANLKQIHHPELHQLIHKAHANVIQSEKQIARTTDDETLKRLGVLEQKVISMTLELHASRERETHLEETLKGFINIEKFASLHQICLLLAHKMRNPLQIIKSSSEQILRSSSNYASIDPKLVQSGAKRVENATQDITDLVHNILETIHREE